CSCDEGNGYVSPMKSKLKVTGKSDSPKIIKESDKVPVVKGKSIDVIEKSTVVKESDKALVVVNGVSEKLVVDEKDNPKVTSKVSKGKSLEVFKYKRKTELPKDNQKDNPNDKESDKAPIVAAVVSEKVVVDEKDNQKVTSKISKVSDESDKATVVGPFLKEKPADVIEKSTVVKESDKAPVVKESYKVPVVNENDKALVVAPVLKEKPADVIEKSTVVNEKEKLAVDVTSKVSKDKEKPAVDVTSKVGKSKVVVHKDKALDIVLKDKPKGNPPSVVGKGNAPSVVGKANDKPYVVKGKVPTELPKKKHKADIPKDKPKPKDKHKVDSEVQVLRFKPKVKVKASVSEVVKRKRMLSKEDHSKKKLELNMIKGKMVSDEVDSDEVKSGLKSNKKGKKKEKQLAPEEAAHEEYLREFPTLRARYALSKFSSTTYMLTFETSDYVEITPSKIHDILGDIASKVISAQQVNFLFKVNFLTLFTNKMGRVAGLKGRTCLDVLSYLDSTKFDRFPVVRTRPAIRDSASTLMRKIWDLETKEYVIGCLDLHKEWTKSELQETEEDLMRKASSNYPGDQKFVKLQEKYVQVFKDPISFDVDVNSVDGGNNSDGDDDGDDDNDDGNGNNDEELNDDNDDGNGNNYEELNDDNDDGNGNNNEELNDEDTLGSNSSFGLSKIGLDDFYKQPSQEGTDAEKESVDPTQEGTVVEVNPAEECEIISTPENYTQWFERNTDLVGEIIDAITVEYLYGDLFGDNSVRMEVSNQGPPTSDRMPTRASNACASPGKQIVKPSSYLLSPYMNKKTKVVPKITRLEFSIGNSLFAMQCDKIVYGIRLNLETLAPGLWIDANVIDCWGAILNHEEKFRYAKSKSKSIMYNSFKLNVQVIEMPILTSTTSMTILDNNAANYDTKYKEVCDLLKKLFVRHLKLYGHSRHGTVGRLKHRIPKLKWRTSGNFHD
ncbi:hypothetical protein Tco_0607016, partial [Tanacetum coccineum]